MDVKTDSLAPLLLFIGESLPLPALKIRKSHTCQRKGKKTHTHTRKTEKSSGLGYSDLKMGGRRLFGKGMGLASHKDKTINEKLSGSDLGLITNGG